MRVYLAGAETEFGFVLNAVGYPYRLCSYLALRDNARRHETLRYVRDGSHWIMDSGLFSFMFGAGKGQLNGLEDYERYTQQYLEAMRAWKWPHMVVECDAQRVLGVKETLYLREKYFEPSGLEVMYVWHIPEGEDGLRAMARRYRNVALGVPELRHVDAKNRRLMINRCLRIIRDENPEARIHLLGNTENKLCELPAWSCDSTSWLGAGRWGRGVLFDPRDRQLRSASRYSPKWRTWRAYCEHEVPRAFERIAERYAGAPTQIDYFSQAACCAIAFWLFMQAVSGRRETLLPEVQCPSLPSS